MVILSLPFVRHAREMTNRQLVYRRRRLITHSRNRNNRSEHNEFPVFQMGIVRDPITRECPPIFCRPNHIVSLYFMILRQYI